MRSCRSVFIFVRLRVFKAYIKPCCHACANAYSYTGIDHRADTVTVTDTVAYINPAAKAYWQLRCAGRIGRNTRTLRALHCV